METTGASECLDCIPGTHSEFRTKSTKCDGCDVGQFQNEPRKIGCKNCLEGTAMVGTGAVECLDCIPGTHSELMQLCKGNIINSLRYGNESNMEEE